MVQVENQNTFGGASSTLFDPIMLEAGLFVVGATWRIDSRFAVEVVGPGENGPNELLVNTLGFYTGARVMRAESGAYQIQIVASDEWEIFAEPPTSTEGVGPPPPHEGTGDLAL